MCGRYTLTTKPHDLAKAFGLDAIPQDLTPRYNIAPSQWVPVVTDSRPRRIEAFRWGLVPSWAKDPSAGNRMINARAETVAEKPSFRSAFRRRRCLIPADGFYEWRRDGKRKTPICIRRRDGAPFAFAGLWETWKPADGEVLRTCTIITTEPNALMAKIHDRMPVILAPETYDLWLDPTIDDRDVLRGLLSPCPDNWLQAHAVSTLVNSPAHDEPRCMEAIDD